MNLTEYVKNNGGQTAVARRLGVSQGLVWQWINGKTRITPERAKDIEAKTDGVITRHDLRPDIYGPQQ